MTRIPVYIEGGAKRTFACAVDWLGWCRSGRDEASALEALLAAGPRYARAIASARVGFEGPRSVAEFAVVGRPKGNASTDYGVPGAVQDADERAMSDADVARTAAMLRACWREFDATAAKARGKKLRVGPRGGGRALDAIIRHVIEAECGYLSALGWKAPADPSAEQVRKAVLEGLAASARGEIPVRGPRGGKRWKPRYFARRLAWHALDHAWEIEDRS